MALFEFIALMCFIFFGVIPLFGGLVVLGVYDMKRQEKAKESQRELQQYFLNELRHLREDVEELKGE